MYNVIDLSTEHQEKPVPLAVTTVSLLSTKANGICTSKQALYLQQFRCLKVLCLHLKIHIYSSLNITPSSRHHMLVLSKEEHFTAFQQFESYEGFGHLYSGT